MSHKKYRQETNCLNCGAEVRGKFCSECGQENLDVHENFFHIAFHFISDYFHFDSKFLRSMTPLFVKPGFLTKQYWEGKRVNYIHPLRLYFFAIIIAVLFTNFFYSHYQGEVKRSIIKSNAEVVVDSTATSDGKTVSHVMTEEEKEDQAAIKSLGEGVDRFIHDLKYISFFLLPLYALVFKLLYVRRKSFYVDHLVYTMHLQSFAMLFMGILLMIPLLYAPAIDFVNILTLSGIFVYIVFSLRYLYSQSWGKTILKSVIATILIFFMMMMIFAVYVTYTLLTAKGVGNINFKFY